MKLISYTKFCLIKTKLDFQTILLSDNIIIKRIYCIFQ